MREKPGRPRYKMKIAYIAAGAAGMYCGTCLHDNTAAAALLRKGHQVALIPTYTPMRTDEADVSIDHIFYGGINIYLQQKSWLFRNTPWIVDRLFDNPRLLNWLSRFSASTNAKDLGALTVSVLRGEEGNQRKELAKLVRWLKDSYKPDLVQLNNSMFLGFAREIKRELGVPVLCALQGEDLFLEGMIEPFKSEAMKILRERSRDVDAFISTSRTYSGYMSEFLNVPAEKIHVVKLGIKLEGHGTGGSQRNRTPLIIGYLARICPEKGLHILADAFHRLAGKHSELFLKAAGYLGKKDEPYFEGVLKQIESWNLKERFEYLGEVDRKQKIDFLGSIDVFSVPATYREPKGLYILEAMANGVPVVQPAHGAFPEVLEETRGGILVEPGSPQAIADGIERLILDPGLRETMGQQGKESVHRCYNDDVMAEATIAVYNQYV